MSFADVLGNGKNATLNQNRDKNLRQTEIKEIDDAKFNQYINKYKNSNITYRQSPENRTIYDAETIPLQQALKEGTCRTWLRYHSSKISNLTRDLDTNCRLFLEQNPDIKEKVKLYAIENGNLTLLKSSVEYGTELYEIDLKMAKDRKKNRKMEEYIQNVLKNQNNSANIFEIR